MQNSMFVLRFKQIIRNPSKFSRHISLIMGTYTCISAILIDLSIFNIYLDFSKFVFHFANFTSFSGHIYLIIAQKVAIYAVLSSFSVILGIYPRFVHFLHLVFFLSNFHFSGTNTGIYARFRQNQPRLCTFHAGIPMKLFFHHQAALGSYWCSFSIISLIITLLSHFSGTFLGYFRPG